MEELKPVDYKACKLAVTVCCWDARLGHARRIGMAAITCIEWQRCRQPTRGAG